MGEGILIAFICVTCLLVVFVLTTFLMSYKNIKFDFEGGNLRVQTIGSHLKIYFNDNLIKDTFSPQLFKGEKVEIKINEKDFVVNCRCNSLGNKLSVKVFEGESVVLSNNIEIN